MSRSWAPHPQDDPAPTAVASPTPLRKKIWGQRHPEHMTPARGIPRVLASRRPAGATRLRSPVAVPAVPVDSTPPDPDRRDKPSRRDQFLPHWSQPRRPVSTKSPSGSRRGSATPPTVSSSRARERACRAAPCSVRRIRRPSAAPNGTPASTSSRREARRGCRTAPKLCATPIADAGSTTPGRVAETPSRTSSIEAGR